MENIFAFQTRALFRVSQVEGAVEVASLMRKSCPTFPIDSGFTPVREPRSEHSFTRTEYCARTTKTNFNRLVQNRPKLNSLNPDATDQNH